MIPVHYERLQAGRLDDRERLGVGGGDCVELVRIEEGMYV